MILGVDIGKENIQYAVVDGNLNLKEKGKLSFSQLTHEFIRDFFEKNKIEIVIAEFTGIYTLSLYKKIKESGVKTKFYYVHSNHSDILRKRFFKSKKNDEIDAFIIAKSYAFKEILNELNVEDFVLEIIELVRQHKLIKKYLRNAKSLVKADADLFSNEHLKESIDLLEKKKKEIENEIKALLINSKYSKILKIDGISYVSLAYILAEVKDIRRFPTVWKFLAYSGVAPVEFSSGSYSIKRTTSRVNKELKSIFRMCALSVIKKEPYKTIYEKKREQGKHHYVALSHVAKRIAKKVYFALLSC